MRTKGSKDDWIRYVYVCVSMNNGIFFFWFNSNSMCLLDKNWGQNSVWMMNLIHRIYLFFLMYGFVSNSCRFVKNNTHLIFMWNRNYFNFDLHQCTHTYTEKESERDVHNSSIRPNLQFPAVDKECTTDIRFKQNTCVKQIELFSGAKIQLFKSMRMWNLTPFS